MLCRNTDAESEGEWDIYLKWSGLHEEKAESESEIGDERRQVGLNYAGATFILMSDTPPHYLHMPDCTEKLGDSSTGTFASQHTCKTSKKEGTLGE